MSAIRGHRGQMLARVPGPSSALCPAMSTARLTGRGIPVSCEVDIYGALSRIHRHQCVTGQDAVTLLDINNTVPKEMYQKHIQQQTGYGRR